MKEWSFLRSDLWSEGFVFRYFLIWAETIRLEHCLSGSGRQGGSQSITANDNPRAAATWGKDHGGGMHECSLPFKWFELGGVAGRLNNKSSEFSRQSSHQSSLSNAQCSPKTLKRKKQKTFSVIWAIPTVHTVLFPFIYTSEEQEQKIVYADGFTDLFCLDY